MNTYAEQRYERLLESLDEYLAQDFGDGSNGFAALQEDMNRAITEMKKYPILCLKNVNNFEELIS